MIDDFQLSAVVTSYGTGTRSYNRSAEARLMKKARANVTDRWQRGELTFDYEPGMLEWCACSAEPYSHPWHRDELALFEQQRSMTYVPCGRIKVQPATTGKRNIGTRSGRRRTGCKADKEVIVRGRKTDRVVKRGR